MRTKNILLIALILGISQLIQAKPIVYPVDFEWNNDSIFYRFTIHFSRVNTVGEIRKMIAHALHVQPDEVKILKRKTLAKWHYLEDDTETARQAGIIVYGPPGLSEPGKSEFQVELVGGKEPNIDKNLGSRLA